MQPVRYRLLPVYTLVFIWSAPAFMVASHQEAPPARQLEQPNEDPTKGSKDIDQVLDYPMAAILEVAKRAAATYGCQIRKEKGHSFECTRTRHVGVFVGSGGEKVTVHLETVADGTRVRIKTGKGFVGRLGKKNWSTPIYKQMLSMLEES